MLDPSLPSRELRLLLDIKGAEVRVNGAPLGSVPYIGETSCRVGEPLAVEIVPTKGPVQRSEHVCRAGVLRID